MRSGVSDLHEERTARRFLFVLPKIPDIIVTDRVGVINLLWLVIGIVFGSDERVLAAERNRIKETAGAFIVP